MVHPALVLEVGMLCAPCKGADKETDTVKIDPRAFKVEREADASTTEEQQQQHEEEKRRSDERKRLAAEEHRLAEVERLAQERLAQELAEKQRLDAVRRQEDDAALKRQQEHDRRRAEQLERHKEEVDTAREREEEDARKLEKWLAAKKFHDPNAKKSKWFKSSLPLHQAVMDVNAEMVRILIAHNADVNAENSSKQTPAQLAEKLSQKGPGKYDSVLSALRK